MSNAKIALLTMLVLDVCLTLARVLEYDNGHIPTEALTAAFDASITATLGAASYLLHKNGIK